MGKSRAQRVAARLGHLALSGLKSPGEGRRSRRDLRGKEPQLVGPARGDAGGEPCPGLGQLGRGERRAGAGQFRRQRTGIGREAPEDLLRGATALRIPPDPDQKTCPARLSAPNPIIMALISADGRCVRRCQS